MNKDLNNGCVNTRVAYSHNHVCGQRFINKISSVSPTLFNVLKYYMFYKHVSTKLLLSKTRQSIFNCLSMISWRGESQQVVMPRFF